MKKILIRILLAALNSRWLNGTPCKYGFIGNVDAFSYESLCSEDNQQPGITVREVLATADAFRSCPIKEHGCHRAGRHIQRRRADGPSRTTAGFRAKERRRNKQMKAMLGEEGTEQFTIDIEFNGRKFPQKKLHDPFIRTRIGISRWDLFKGLFRKQFEVRIRLEGTHMVQRHIMMLDPEQLALEEKQFLEEMRISRETSPAVGYYVESK